MISVTMVSSEKMLEEIIQTYEHNRKTGSVVSQILIIPDSSGFSGRPLTDAYECWMVGDAGTAIAGRYVFLDN